jgi:two-component system cell cycle response regulator
VLTAFLYAASDTVGITAGLAVGAALVAAGTLLIVLRRLRGGSGNPEEGVSALVRDLDQRLRQLGERLSEELERTKEESRRSRYLGELSWTIEMEEVMRRTLDAAARLDGVDAALVTALDGTDEPLTKGAGLSEEEVRRLELDQRQSGGRVQSLTISYAAPVPAAPNGPAPVAIGLQVPIEARTRTIGVVSVFSRDERPFPDETHRALEDLAARAGPALDNARRYLEARRLADLDARTGLHNYRYFDETLEREVARARRYHRKLALVVFDLDDFKQINDRLGHPVGNVVLAGVAERMREVLRSADVAARYGGDEFAVVLPESGVEEAEKFYDRLRAHIAASPIAPVGQVGLSCGVGEIEGQEDWESFFRRVDDALYRAKQAGKGQVVRALSGVRVISDDVLGSAISEIEEANNNGAR